MFVRSVGVGIAGGVAAAAIWYIATLILGRELGWLACAIGLAAGLAVRRSSAESERWIAVSAAMLAAFAVMMSTKYVVAASVAAQKFSVLRSELVVADEETMVATVADEIAQERMQAGLPVTWPQGMTYEDAMVQADYPSDIWNAARQRWSGCTRGEQQQRIAQHEQKLNALANELQRRMAKRDVAAAYGVLGLGWPLAGLFLAFGCTAFRRDD